MEPQYIYPHFNCEFVVVVTDCLNAPTYYCKIFIPDAVFLASLLGYHINQCQKLMVLTASPLSKPLVTLL